MGCGTSPPTDGAATAATGMGAAPAPAAAATGSFFAERVAVPARRVAPPPRRPNLLASRDGAASAPASPPLPSAASCLMLLLGSSMVAAPAPGACCGLAVGGRREAAGQVAPAAVPRRRPAGLPAGEERGCAAALSGRPAVPRCGGEGSAVYSCQGQACRAAGSVGAREKPAGAGWARP